jgi:predicted regulator of Ras-like GTPase activity (Roadblock/LC7/MglB family)
MEASLTSLFELDGVRGTFIFDQKGQIVRAKTHPIYDQELLRKASQSLEKSIESLQTHHGDWESVLVHFSEGKLLLRNLGPMALAVIADSSINLAFVNVAVNVAVKKLTQIIETKGADIAAASAPTVEPGLTGSGLSGSGLTSSGLGASGLAVTMDQETTAYLGRCTKALAKAVGPMAKVFVKESVRSLGRSGKFTRDQIPQLVKLLEEKIEAADEKEKFRRDVGY